MQCPKLVNTEQQINKNPHIATSVKCLFLKIIILLAHDNHEIFQPTLKVSLIFPYII